MYVREKNDDEIGTDHDCEEAVQLLSHHERQEHPSVKIDKKASWCFIRVATLTCGLVIIALAARVASSEWRTTTNKVERKQPVLPTHGTVPLQDKFELQEAAIATTTNHSSVSTSNTFVDFFEKTMVENVYPFVAFIIDGGKVYCRHEQLNQMYERKKDRGRFKFFAQLATKAIADFAEESTGTSATSTAPEIEREALLLTGKISEGGGLPFLVMYGDGNGCNGSGHEHESYHFPRLTWSIPSRHQSCLAISVPGYKSWTDHMDKVSPSEWEVTFREQDEDYSWSSKIDKAFWRGSPTGHTQNNDFETLPRARLVKHSMENPEIIDAALFHLSERFIGNISMIAPITRIEPSVQQDDFMKYRAVIDIDGNDWSSRFGELLCMNSVVIKIEPDFVEYFYSEIQPWTHYVPVYGNLTNLVDVVEYVLDKKNNEQMKRIVRASRSWCKDHLTGKQMASDMRGILLSYADALGSRDEHWREKWIKNTVASGRDADLVEYTGFVPFAEMLSDARPSSRLFM